MNKGELIAAIAEKSCVSKVEAARRLDTILACVREGVDEHGRVAIAGFGAFRKRIRKARTTTNPATGGLLEIKSFSTVGFTPSDALRIRM